VETRPYFILGDIVSNLTAGAFVGGACALLLPAGWNMLATMVLGMALGMLLSLPVGFLLSGLFGAMETLLPVMTTGMVAGMVVAMQPGLATMRFADGARLGGWCGCGVVVATYLANAVIKPRAKRWTT
jgi:hypothetical protein